MCSRCLRLFSYNEGIHDSIFFQIVTIKSCTQSSSPIRHERKNNTKVTQNLLNSPGTFYAWNLSCPDPTRLEGGVTIQLPVARQSAAFRRLPTRRRVSWGRESTYRIHETRIEKARSEADLIASVKVIRLMGRTLVGKTPHIWVYSLTALVGMKWARSAIVASWNI